MTQLWDRFGPLIGVPAVVCTFIGVLIMLNPPQDSDSDAKIVSYFHTHSHQTDAVLAFVLFFAGVFLLLGFLAALRERLVAVEGRPGRLSALVWGAGIASVPLWLVSALLGNATAMSVGQTSRFRVDPNTYRLTVDTAYMSWVSAVMISSLVVWGTSVLALRTGLLPRWFAWLGMLVGLIQLIAFLFFPVFAWWVWIVLASVLLVRRRPGESIVPAPAAA
jgi:hypothetical protein